MNGAVIENNDITMHHPMIPLIEKAIVDPNVDVSKMQQLLDMQITIMDRDAKQSYIRDFAQMQSEFPAIRKRGKTQQSTYATFDDINDGTAYARGKYGFALSFVPETGDGIMKITATMSHHGGHTETSSMSLPFDTSGNKNNVQAIGSALKYGMRYGIVALLSVSTHDGDDNDASQLFDPIDAGEAPSLEAAASLNKVDAERVFRYFSKKLHRHIDSWDTFPAGSYGQVLKLIESKAK